MRVGPVWTQEVALDGRLHAIEHEPDLSLQRLKEKIYIGVIGFGVIATPLWAGFLVYMPGRLIGWW